MISVNSAVSNNYKYLLTVQDDDNYKQAGAELCQAQGKLILVWPLLDHCLL